MVQSDCLIIYNYTIVTEEASQTKLRPSEMCCLVLSYMLAACLSAGTFYTEANLKAVTDTERTETFLLALCLRSSRSLLLEHPQAELLSCVVSESCCIIGQKCEGGVANAVACFKEQFIQCTIAKDEDAAVGGACGSSTLNFLPKYEIT